MSSRSRVGVIGQGYVGLEVSISLVKTGRSVIGFEISHDKCKSISQGRSPVENVYAGELQSAIDSGSYKITTEFCRLSECDVIIICVPTPITEDDLPDLSALDGAVENICQFVSPSTLIINESTSYPGTLRTVVAERILSRRPDIGSSLSFGVAPERVSPGNGVPLSKVPRVVSGIDEKSKELTSRFYLGFCEEVRVVDTPEIAEAAKLLENTFRHVNIAFINEFNLICRRLGIDTREVIDAAATKPFGFMRFEPGAGIGGHCIPVDPLYFQYVSRLINLESEFIDLAVRSNHEHAKKLLEYVLGKSQMTSPRILLLGVGFKEGISDTRESPAENFLSYLKMKGLVNGWFDPLVKSWNGSSQADMDEKWDIALVVNAQPGLPIQRLLDNDVKVYDFTGRFSTIAKVIQI